MRVLLLGGTGNLGLRMLPALLAHGHGIVAYVRSESKLRSLISPRLAERITIHIGDAFDTEAVEAALREHECDAIMSTAGNHEPPWREQTLWKIAASVSSAGVRVGQSHGKPLRLWIIGGLTSLVYPFAGNLEGSRWQAQDFMPGIASNHHRGTEMVMRKVDKAELEWSVLCVAWMVPVDASMGKGKRVGEGEFVVDLLERPAGNELVVKAEEMVDWQGSWVGEIPVVGRTLDLFWCLGQYTTKLEEVADLIAEDLASGEKSFAGEFVGMKEREKMGKVKSM